MFREYPVGAPTVIRHELDKVNINECFGICKATVLPPRELFMPLLPMRTSNGRLVFTLCSICAEEETDTPYCNHSDNERALKQQVYTTPELIRALELGYELQSVDEIWHWDN